MRQDFIEFLPTHKLQLLTNYPPTVQGSDYGIWRRLVLVPYDVKFGTAEDIAAGKATALVDPTLPESLRAEREGIFAWIVAGAVEWYRAGLRVPEVIRRATDQYQSDSDRVSGFVDDRCVKDGDAWVSSTELHQTYKYWCSDHGYRPLGWHKLVVELRRVIGPSFELGERKVKNGTGRKTARGCRGLSLIDGVLDRFNPTEPAPPLVLSRDQQLARELT
jgi:putative DNA primase/helicase